MKVLCSILATASLLSSSLFLFAQVEKTSSSPASTITSREINNIPFARGSWEYLIRQNVEYHYFKNTQEGQSYGHQNEFRIDIGADYFVANRIGIGLDFDADWTGYHYQSDNTSSLCMAYGNIMYGIPVNQNFNIYGKAAIGYGTQTIKYKSSGTSTSTKDNIYGYKLAVGTPIRFFERGPVYLTPQVSWNYLSTSFDGGKEKDNGLRVALGFEAYMGCRDFMCDCHHGFSLSKNIYQPGTSFFDFDTRGNFGFGTLKTTYSGSSAGSQQQNYSLESIGLGYDVYILHNIAIGGRVEIGGNSQKDKTTNIKSTTGRWMITPMVEFNLPVNNGWNNTFLKAGVGFGSEKNSTSGSSISSSLKYNIFSYYTLIGYNDFIAKRLAFTPKIGYEWNSFKNTTTDIKQKSSGLQLEFGMRLFLGAKWKY
jgi:hypothetical protein